jgi:uncharacterized protein (TIGR00297 family)
MDAESRRKALHIVMGAFAFALRLITWWQAAVCATAAVAFNALVLPRIGGHTLHRPGDTARGYPIGILIYPLSVLLLIVAFPKRPDIAAAAWGILACGDGFATIVGLRFGRHRLPWNPDKSFEGSAAFFVAGGSAGIVLAWWTSPAISPVPAAWFIVAAPLLAAFTAALVETVPIRLDDNFSVPAVAGATLWGMSLVSPAVWTASWPAVAAHLVPALVVNGVAAFTGWRVSTVRTSGMLAGWVIGVTIYACAGPKAWALLLATFLAAALSSRLGLRKKALLGIAEEREGRRGGGNAFANTGVAAIAALVSVLTPYPDAALLALVAALTAGGSDTIASEIGKAWGKKTYLITTFAEVRPGTPGAMSLEGTAAGIVGAFALAAVGVTAGLIPASAIWIVVGCAVAGSAIESALGATLEAPGIVNNDVLNFVNTAAAAILAVAIGT